MVTGVILSLHPRRLLNEERGQAGGNECDSPNHVEVEPGLTKKGEAELAIDYLRDDARHRKIRCGVDCGGEHPGERASGGNHAIVTCHLSRFDRAVAQQHRQNHQPCTVRRGHQKRPGGQVSQAYLHADPPRM
jgi:hypothetical protein